MVVIQEPGELALAVLAEAPDPVPVSLQQAEVRSGAITATFQVIGASHLVNLRVDGRPWLSETLSCLPIPPAGCLHHHSFVDLADHDTELTEFGYQVRVRLSSSPGTVGAQGPSGENDGLTVAFPAVFGRRPVTRITWVTDETGLSWTTLHTYPDPTGSTTVTSRTVLRVPSKHRRPGEPRPALP